MKDDPDGKAEPLLLSTDLTANGGFLTRRSVAYVLDHLAQEANKHRDDERKIAVHPHRLRHTFGAWYRDKTGSDTETAAALGHMSIKYVGIYATRSRAEREAVLDEMKVGE